MPNMPNTGIVTWGSPIWDALMTALRMVSPALLALRRPVGKFYETLVAKQIEIDAC